MTVVMVANEPDWSRFKIKFSANYKSITASSTCSFEYNANQGQLNSPNYPSHYPNNAACSWKITISHSNDDDHIVISFESLDVEFTPGCWADALQIHDGNNSQKPSLGQDL